MYSLIRACNAHEDDLAVLRVRVLRELRKLVSFDAAFLAATDPETMLFTAAFADEPLVEAGPRFLDNEFAAVPDVNRFADLAVAAAPVASLDTATRGERAISPRWREIIAPLGMGDEARVALRVDNATWGVLCLHRSGPIEFQERELALLRKAAPHMGEAIRRVVAASARENDIAAGTATQGMAIVVDDTLLALGGAAEFWLEQLAGAPIAIGAPLPLPVLAVVRRLTTLEQSDLSAPPPVIRLGTRSGALVTVHATRLRDAQGDGPIALTITPAANTARASLLLDAHGLTPAQRRVAQLVLQGRTTRQIVIELRISEHTVQDHLKAVFDKVGFRSRRELVTAVMRPAR